MNVNEDNNDTILLTANSFGIVFEGNRTQFRDVFFGNADNDEILDFSLKEKWNCTITHKENGIAYVMCLTFPTE